MVDFLSKNGIFNAIFVGRKHILRFIGPKINIYYGTWYNNIIQYETHVLSSKWEFLI